MGKKSRSPAPTGWAEARRRIAAERDNPTGFLELGNLGLTSLPPELFELTELEALNLGMVYTDLEGDTHNAPDGPTNRLRELNPDFARLRRLWRLSMDCNDIDDLAPLAGMTSLRDLDVNSTSIVTLAPLARLRSLESLDCSFCSIEDLSSLGSLGSLTNLSINGSKVSDLSPLRRLERLQSLGCSYNQISDLSPLADLSRLEHLSCSNNPVPDIRPLARLASLRSLSCGATQVGDIAPLAGLTALLNLSLYDTNFSDLSPLANVKFLRSLTISATRVADLRPLAGLLFLQVLHCSATAIGNLTALAGLLSLRRLSFSDTAVADLSPLTDLTGLIELSCSRTPVSDFSTLAKLTALKSLECGGTSISEVSVLSRLKHLQELDISHTRVADLSPLPPFAPPEEEYAWRSGLKANGCTLGELPVALVGDTNLSRLYLFESRVADLPPEVRSQDPDDDCLERVRTHLRDLEAGVLPLRTSKVIVLGNGRVGKTQLCRRLCGLGYDESVPSTHGITIASAPFDDDEVLNLWDFGGQDIYHGAHALFMKTRAIFVIVWHPDFEDSPTHEHEGLEFRNHPLVYWLEFVRAMGAPGSPIVIVQARCERRGDERSLPVKPEVLEGLSVITAAYSARTDRGRGTLNDAIKDAIDELRARDGTASIGVGRARVVEQLEKWRAEDHELPPGRRRHRTLTRRQFAAMCTRVQGVSSPETLLHYLHHCGLVFHDSGRFGERILLDQSWALDAIYSVFDRQSAWRHLQGTHGRFSRKLLETTVWRDFSADDQRLFLQLMLSCGICFRYRGDQRYPVTDYDEYIAPDLLPTSDAIAEHLEGRWDDAAPVRRLSYAYEFLHPGLFRGLMSDIGQTAENAGLYWRTGLWLYASKSRARVRIELDMKNERSGRIELKMQGDDPQLAEWLRERFARQHRLYGQASLAPEVDELPRPLHSHEERRVGPPKRAEAEPTRRDEPSFAVLPPDEFVRASPPRPHVYISYAWGDGKLAADALHAVLRTRDIELHLDRTDIKVGDRISAFMDRLTRGDRIFVVVSEKYLQSEACMYELFGIWRRAQADPDAFLERVIPIVMANVRIGNLPERFAHAEYWDARHKEHASLVKKAPHLIGGTDFTKFKWICDYRQHITDILALLNDRLVPRGYEQLAETGFAEVLHLLPA